MKNMGNKNVVELFGFVGLFKLVKKVLINMIKKKYVNNIYLDYRKGKYYEICLNLIIREKKIKLKKDDVDVKDVKGMFKYLKIKGINLFVEKRIFDENENYEKMMGYEKKIEFKLSEKYVKKKKNKEKKD
jgi:hypothetical protein